MCFQNADGLCKEGTGHYYFQMTIFTLFKTRNSKIKYAKENVNAKKCSFKLHEICCTFIVAFFTEINLII